MFRALTARQALRYWNVRYLMPSSLSVPCGLASTLRTRALSTWFDAGPKTFDLVVHRHSSTCCSQTSEHPSGVECPENGPSRRLEPPGPLTGYILNSKWGADEVDEDDKHCF
ncbi:hypothetical protein B0T26DRAFT_245175 [Lasiosphaeria miniovina]|uniref:Uncharacterized protein n=1 Tax=Lasiosphaeria miniovina TaxID=1954250 RepID=A0AA40AW43_9PEZI|nr:uncharacterized protein B0T26DRAFT_245175 [Lasiosphaeria miniovina]KAK0723014.1 hypothetical protein B0T26DRAFT_245175 [Lasiosphaeria miniovina]